MLDTLFLYRFDHWLRWCLSKGHYQSRCGSLEGLWRSPQCWDERLPRPPPIDLLAAILVNRGYIGIADIHRRTIKYLYFRNWRPQWIAQKLGCHHTQLGDYRHRARLALANRIAFLDKPARLTA